jgi:DNA replication licensing factor MCM3
MDETNQRPHSIWQRSRYESQSSVNDSNSSNSDVLQHDFLRKYLHFAKTRVKPVLTEEARERIASRYAEMRSRQDERTLPVTARSLETVIRLATAHAKARLSPIVEAEADVGAAMDILSFALYHENINAGNQRPDTPDLEDQRPGKKMRSTKTEQEEGETSSEDQTDQKQVQDLKTRIWNELRAADGAKPMDEICADVEDRSSIDIVIRQLADQQKIMADEDGMVYLQ